MAANTFTLRDSGAAYSATLRYVKAEAAMPAKNKTFSRYQLADGSYSYDYPSNAVKRRWVFEVDGESAGDALLATLNSLYALTENLLLDIDLDATIFTADGTASGLAVHFEEFYPAYQVGSQFIYRLVLQEV